MSDNRCEFNPDILVMTRKNKLKLSQDEFLKKLYSFSNGNCSMSRTQLRGLESGKATTRVNPYTLSWVFRFSGISPNQIFGWNEK